MQTERQGPNRAHEAVLHVKCNLLPGAFLAASLLLLQPPADALHSPDSAIDLLDGPYTCTILGALPFSNAKTNACGFVCVPGARLRIELVGLFNYAWAKCGSNYVVCWAWAESPAEALHCERVSTSQNPDGYYPGICRAGSDYVTRAGCSQVS